MPMAFCKRRLGAGFIKLDLAAGEIGGIDFAQRQVGIGDGGFGAAAAIADGAGGGAGAVRPHGDAVQFIDAGDGAAAGADLHHFDDGNAHRNAGALHVAVGAGDFKLAGALGFAVGRAGRSWRWCRPCRRRRLRAGRIRRQFRRQGWRRPPGPIPPGGWESAPRFPRW